MSRSPDKPDRNLKTFTVVLTGGIASGKTAVSDEFARLGIPVIDTDRIAREIVEPGQPALNHITETFGAEFLDSHSGLNRRKMREVIFTDPVAKSRLEAILHPLIAEKVIQHVHEVNAPYCLLVIPLFAESSAYTWIDRVLVVDVDEEVQIQRVMERDQINREQAESILAAQASRKQRAGLADDLLDNSGTLKQLQQKVGELHRKYLELAARN